MHKILVIDDDDKLRLSFELLLSQEGYSVTGAPSGESGLKKINADMPDLVILDIRLPGMNGLETFLDIHKLNPKLPVIIMTAYGTTETAIKATKMGAFDYILKPFEIPEMLSTVSQAIETARFTRSTVDINSPPERITDQDVIIGKSKCMQEVYKAIGKVAPTDATVLIRGESGTGKELIAKAVYQHSLRASRPFVVINCVAIPETLLESELFGYEKGAFTGASHRRMGKIELANNGTVFLDEIGDMPSAIQAKILRLLQEKSIERLGGREIIPVDVRIIAATNRNLETSVDEGKFRQDLYYRLKVVTIQLPRLRERASDIPLLVSYFIPKYASEMGLNNPGITDQAQKILNIHIWPGNIRELANIIQKALIFNRGNPISPEEITTAIGFNLKGAEALIHDNEKGIRLLARNMLLSRKGENIFESSVDRFSSALISEALNLTGGNISKAARFLGVSRPTLHSRIEKYRLKIESSVKEE